MTAEACCYLWATTVLFSPLSWPPAINLILLLAARLAPMQLQNKAVNIPVEGNPVLAILKWLLFHTNSQIALGIWKVLSNV